MKRIVILSIFMSLSITGMASETYNEGKVQSYSNLFVPGLSATSLTTFNGMNTYIGGSFHLSLVNFFEHNSKKEYSNIHLSPACWELFVELNLYKGLSLDINDDYIFNYLIGANTSFDRSFSINRYFFIPYYGIKVGGIYINNNNIEYNGVCLTPFIGISFVRTRYLMINFDCSLLVSTIQFKETLAFSPNLLISFSL